MKAKSIRFLDFLTPNFIPEENKREMDTQKTNMWRPGREMQFSYAILGQMSSGILAKLHPIIWYCLSVWVFSWKFLQYFQNILL